MNVAVCLSLSSKFIHRAGSIIVIYKIQVTATGDNTKIDSIYNTLTLAIEGNTTGLPGVHKLHPVDTVQVSYGKTRRHFHF